MKKVSLLEQEGLCFLKDKVLGESLTKTFFTIRFWGAETILIRFFKKEKKDEIKENWLFCSFEEKGTNFIQAFNYQTSLDFSLTRAFKNDFNTIYFLDTDDEYISMLSSLEEFFCCESIKNFENILNFLFDEGAFIDGVVKNEST